MATEATSAFPGDDDDDDDDDDDNDKNDCEVDADTDHHDNVDKHGAAMHVWIPTLG